MDLSEPELSEVRLDISGQMFVKHAVLAC